MIRPPRPLSDEEISALLGADVPARLATLDREGFPHVTPLWFIWDDGVFYLTSFPDRPHLRRLERDRRAGICVDVEEPERSDGDTARAGAASGGRQRLSRRAWRRFPGGVRGRRPRAQ